GRKTIADVSHFYQTVQNGLGMELLLETLMKQPAVCFDTETTSINPLEAELVGIAFSWSPGKGFYVPFPESKNDAMPLIEKLRPFFESETIQKIGQNLKYDIKVMLNYDV